MKLLVLLLVAVFLISGCVSSGVDTSKPPAEVYSSLSGNFEKLDSYKIVYGVGYPSQGAFAYDVNLTEYRLGDSKKTTISAEASGYKVAYSTYTGSRNVTCVEGLPLPGSTGGVKCLPIGASGSLGSIDLSALNNLDLNKLNYSDLEFKGEKIIAGRTCLDFVITVNDKSAIATMRATGEHGCEIGICADGARYYREEFYDGKCVPKENADDVCAKKGGIITDSNVTDNISSVYEICRDKEFGFVSLMSKTVNGIPESAKWKYGSGLSMTLQSFSTKVTSADVTPPVE